MQFETSLSMCVCVCVCPCVYTCVSILGGGVSVWGEVAVKSVLFSPVGWICSLQICTACYCNRSHSCCSRCSRLQRRVCTEPEQAGPEHRAICSIPLPLHHFQNCPESLGSCQPGSFWSLFFMASATQHPDLASSYTCSLVLSLLWCDYTWSSFHLTPSWPFYSSQDFPVTTVRNRDRKASSICHFCY